MDTSIDYPSIPEQEVRVPAQTLHSVIEQLLVKHSMFRFDAKVATARLVEADLYGKRAHGVILVKRIIDAIENGNIDPRGKVLTNTDSACFATLDGSRTIGTLAATQGSELAVSKAKEQGVGVVAIGNSQTLGAAEVYVRLMAEQNVIGICLTSTGGATVTAPGTLHGAVGNCAFAYSVPLKDHSPIVFDSACGSESWGKLALLERYGMQVPEGILINAEQHPVQQLSNAVAMLPSGGSLGFGLSMLCSILAGPLGGGWLPLHKTRPTDSEDSQHFFLALDPAKFCNVDKFQTEIVQTLEKIRSLPPINEEEPVRIPGDRSTSCHQEYEATGIPLHRTIADTIKQLAIAKKIVVDWD